MCIFTILALLGSFIFLFLYLSEHFELKDTQDELFSKNNYIDRILRNNTELEVKLGMLRKEYYTVRSQYLTCKKVNKRLRSMVGSLSKKKKIK